MSKYTLYTDGASRGNPGKSAIAYVIVRDDEHVEAFHAEYIGDKITNNTAEYMAIIKGLEECERKGIKDVEIVSDSKVVISQLKGEYKVYEQHLKVLYEQVKNITKSFRSISCTHTTRDNYFIQMADSLCNEVLDGVGKAIDGGIEK